MNVGKYELERHFRLFKAGIVAARRAPRLLPVQKYAKGVPYIDKSQVVSAIIDPSGDRHPPSSRINSRFSFRASSMVYVPRDAAATDNWHMYKVTQSQS